MKNLTLIFFIFSLLSYSQNNFTSARSIEISENNYEEQLRSSIVKNIELTNIGPSVMSGRVTDLEVNPNNPTEFYVAYASGGLWHTKNNGTTFSPTSINFSFMVPAILGRFGSGTHRSAHRESDRKTLAKSLHLSVGTYIALFLLFGTYRLINFSLIIDFNLSVKRFLEILRLF